MIYIQGTYKMETPWRETLWRPGSGDYIQVWDSLRDNEDPGIQNHGEYGLIVGESKKTDSFLNDRGERVYLKHITEGEVYRVLLDGHDDVVHVHYRWLKNPFSG